MKSSRRHYAVDRIENDLAVLLDDEGTGFAVPLRQLPLALREGMVLAIRTDRDGRPDWRTAAHDETEERWRLEDAAERLERLKGRDPDREAKQ
jgi:hypothetical protein